MASSSRRRHCSNDPNIFCYVCGSFTLKDQRRNITGFVKSVYLAYFKVPKGDQDKHWAPHNVCKTCVETLRAWSQGKNAKLKFGVPMVWREPSNHLDDCYFCLINVKGFNKKNKQYLQYPSIPSAIRPVPHSEEIPVPIFSELPKTDDADLSSLASSDEEDSAAIFKPCDEDCDKPILFNQCDLNDLVRDLYLPKESAELLASRLQEHRMLKPGTNVTFYRNREVELHQAAKSGEGKDSEEPSKPFLLPAENRNVTTTVFQNAYLHCRISSLGDEAQVSWIRKRDLHVLSSGKHVFSTDQRFQVVHPEKSENWTLLIKFSQLRDSGVYECQVNTNPKISMAFTLNVVDSKAEIQGPEYVKAGSTINLTCTISEPSNGGLIYWYRNGEMLDYEGQVTIVTKNLNKSTASMLTITSAQTSHSGNYTCWPTLAKPTSVLINVVLEGEQPAAMQTGASHRPTWNPLLPTLILCFSLYDRYLENLKRSLPAFLR